ncbi:MAG: hypothetical protein L0Y64_23360 [Myxococcaceae bacterium]|nr:hypothetical protein [Myxococcaceae bacterium]
MVQEHLAHGTLVELVPGKRLDVVLYWQEWRLQSRLMEELSRAIRAGGRAELR